jgi:hypothetical protein
LPAAALLYRRGDVREASMTYVFAPTREQLFNEAISPTTSVALRTASERGKLVIALPKTPALPWLEQSPIPSATKILTDPNISLLDTNARGMTSDTGELQRNWEQGTYSIDTPRTQAAMGWIGGRDVNLADVRFSIVTRNATVVVQSLDGNSPISTSRAILISLGARSVPAPGNRLPFFSEPVIGRLSIRAPPGLRLATHAKPGHGARQIAAPYIAGRYEITLNTSLASYWLELK